MKKLREAQANDKRFPHIKFNYQNFEDFLSLHLDTQKAKAWSNIGETHQHQTRPMLANEYLSLFKELVPNYKKGQLPDDFDMTVALDNLKKNIILKELSQSSEMADFILQLLNSHQ